MKNLFLLLGILSSAWCVAGTTDTIPASDSRIEYTGRIDFTNPDVPTFSYSGVSIRACFTGTSIAIIMNDNIGQNYYNLILDGNLLDTVRITQGKKLYQIAEGLENTTHEIEIFKRTEEMFGKTQFFGFVVDEGMDLTAITNPRARLFEFIGNSITCGYGNEGVNGGTFGPTTENHYLTYAAFTSRNFSARHLAVCKSGIGIYRNYDGPAAGNADCMTNYYTRTYLYDENPKYSFTDRPDLICIDLGTNDFSTTGGDSAKFVSNYFRLVDTLQTKYSMPDIVCLIGPMVSDPTLAKIKKFLVYIADSAGRKGKGNVTFFEMPQQTGSLGIGIDYHPTVAQHQKNGMELTEYIRSLKGWKITPLILNAHITETHHIKIEFNTIVTDTLNVYSGFAILGNEQQYTIDNVYRDTENQKFIHILLQEGIDIGEKITLRYAPGSIESEDSVMVGTIYDFPVQNNLSETKITKGTSNPEGTKVTLTFNKNLKTSTLIEGLSLTRDGENIAVDSFSLKNTQLILFISDTIMKGDSVFAGYNGTSLYGADGIPLSSFSKLVIKNNSTYSIVPVNSENVFALYPNPNHSGIFYYCIDRSILSRKAVLEVIANNGILIYRQLLTASEGQLILPGPLTKGICFFKITAGNSVRMKSVVID